MTVPGASGLEAIVDAGLIASARARGEELVRKLMSLSEGDETKSE